MALDPTKLSTYDVAFGDQAAPASFWERIEVASTGCWLWKGPLTDQGYGRYGDSRTRTDGRSASVHRWSYQTFVGAVPAGQQVDHLCHTRECTLKDACPHRRCVNPAHLEAVTVRVNVHRSSNPAGLNVIKTHCPAGHRYDEANTRPIVREGKRRCRICRADQFRRAAATRRLRQKSGV